jgi:hypothetical protein
MSDPLYTKPRYSESQFSEPVGRRSDSVGGTWGWVAGIAVIVLIALFLIAGSHGINNTTANLPAGAPGSTTSTTTGMGSPSQFPAHRPATPAPTPAPLSPPPATNSK